METTPSQTQPEGVGGASSGPPSISSSVIKRNNPLRSSPQKRPIETRKKKQPSAKRAKLSTAANQQKSPTGSPLKRPVETSKKKQPTTKRFKPPMVEKMLSGDRSPLVRRSPLARNPEMRLVVYPMVVACSPRSSPPSPAPVLERSPSPSTSPPPYLDEETSLPDSSLVQSKPRRLKSEIWSDMDPMYHGGKLIQARYQATLLKR